MVESGAHDGAGDREQKHIFDLGDRYVVYSGSLHRQDVSHQNAERDEQSVEVEGERPEVEAGRWDKSRHGSSI